jgi:L-seryl-tRNA(Ser) seleniumtransferase
MESAVGGGSLPGQTLPSVGLAIRARHVDQVAAALRRQHPAIIGRIAEGELLLDLRTVAPEEDVTLCKAVASVLGRA